MALKSDKDAKSTAKKATSKATATPKASSKPKKQLEEDADDEDFIDDDVKPVTKGTRYSLVGWVSGKPFK
jgi:hypothetical protein